MNVDSSRVINLSLSNNRLFRWREAGRDYANRLKKYRLTFLFVLHHGPRPCQPHVLQKITACTVVFVSCFQIVAGITSAPLPPSPPRPPSLPRLLSTLICQGGVRGDLRQWSYAASEAQGEDAGGARGGRRPGGGQGRSTEGGDKNRALVVSRKLIYQVGPALGCGVHCVASRERARGPSGDCSRVGCFVLATASRFPIISMPSKIKYDVCLFVCCVR